GDAARTVHGREDLRQPDHVAADAGLTLDEQHPVPLVAEVERCLETGDPRADDEHVGVDASSERRRAHGDSLPTGSGPRASSAATGPSSSTTRARSPTSFTKAFVHTEQIAVSLSLRMSRPRSFICRYTRLIRAARRS